jgi:hypothetical protein
LDNTDIKLEVEIMIRKYIREDDVFGTVKIFFESAKIVFYIVKNWRYHLVMILMTIVFVVALYDFEGIFYSSKLFFGIFITFETLAAWFILIYFAFLF